MAVREYNALNGVEVKNGIGIDLKTELMERLGLLTGSGEVRWAFEGCVESYPNDHPVALRVSGVASGPALDVVEQIGQAVRRQFDLDTRLGQHLSFHRVRWPFQVVLEVLRAEGERPVEHAGAPIVEGRRLDLTPLVRGPEVTERSFTEQRLHAVQKRDMDGMFELPSSPIVNPKDEQIRKLQAELARLTSEAMVLEAPSAIERSETGDQRIVSRTGTGLPILAGPKPSPSPEAQNSWGRGSDVGSVPGREQVERIIVAHTPPGLDVGGEGAPDAVRRQTGQPIPAPPARAGRRDPIADGF